MREISKIMNPNSKYVGSGLFVIFDVKPNMLEPGKASAAFSTYRDVRHIDPEIANKGVKTLADDMKFSFEGKRIKRRS